MPKNLGRGLPLPPHPQVVPIYIVCENWTKSKRTAIFFGSPSLRCWFLFFLIPWFFAGANRGLGTNIRAVLKRDQFRKSSPTGLPFVKNCQSAGDQFVIGLVDNEPVLYYNFHREPSNTQDRLEIIPWTRMRRISSWSLWPMWPYPWSSWSLWRHFDFEQSPQKFWGPNVHVSPSTLFCRLTKICFFSHQWSWDLKRSCGPSFEVKVVWS